MVCVPSKIDVLRQLGEYWMEWLALSPALQLAPQEKVVVLANICSSVVASGAETFSTLFFHWKFGAARGRKQLFA